MPILVMILTYLNLILKKLKLKSLINNIYTI